MKEETKNNLKRISIALLVLLFIFLLSMYLEGKNILEDKENEVGIYYKNISPGDFNKEDGVFFLINVDDEGKKNKIQGTDIFIPYTEIAKEKSKLPKDKEIKMIIYSQNENKSKVAAKKISLLGYKNIFVLLGDIEEWKKNKIEIIEKNDKLF